MPTFFTQIILHFINNIFYLLQNVLEFHRFLRNPLAVVCKSCSKAARDLQTAFLKLLEIFLHSPRGCRKAACGSYADLGQLLVARLRLWKRN
jgi:hypothetical protein